MRKCPKCARLYDDPVRICRPCGAFLEAVADGGVQEEENLEAPPDMAESPAVLTPVAKERAQREEPPPDMDGPPPRRSNRSWQCPQCQQSVPGTFDVCWNCGTSRSGIPDADFVKAPLDSPPHGAEEKPAAQEAARRHGRQCAKCGSTKIIPKVRVLDQGQHSNGDLQVVVYGNPEALVFKDRLYGKLTADICGECGHVELRVENPAELFQHYRQTVK